jgi:hypothetical protein
MKRKRTTEGIDREALRQHDEFHLLKGELEMSQAAPQNALQKQTQELLDGPLKHIRAAALAAALLPLASVAATPASAQECTSASPCGTVSGFVFNDNNSNGIQDGGDTPVENAEVTICVICDGSDGITTFTDNTGFFSTPVSVGSFSVVVPIPSGTVPSPTGQSVDELSDSDGVLFGPASSSAPATVTEGGVSNADFGFAPSAASNPGTGTPGYWKNHPDAWPVSTITIGEDTYTKAQAIGWLGKVGKDKTTTMFSSLVPAILNVLIGNDGSCVNATITAAIAWLDTYEVGSNVPASSDAWKIYGEPLHQTLDAYNNGLICAPHRD